MSLMFVLSVVCLLLCFVPFKMKYFIIIFYKKLDVDFKAHFVICIIN